MRESLSLEAQAWFDRQDYDSIFLPWQIPLDHKSAFEELQHKGYIIETITGENLKAFKFVDDIVTQNRLGELGV